MGFAHWLFWFDKGLWIFTNKCLMKGVGSYNINKDHAGTHLFNNCPQALSEIQETMVSLDLVDIRIRIFGQNSDLNRYTWCRGQQASRIDYFIISFSPASKVSKCIIGDQKVWPCYCNNSNSYRWTSSGAWVLKVNLSLLNDFIFIEKTKVFIREFFEINENSSEPRNVWEDFKCAFRGHAIKMGSWKQKQYLIKERGLID